MLEKEVDKETLGWKAWGYQSRKRDRARGVKRRENKSSKQKQLG